MPDEVTKRVLQDPAFLELESKRNALGWTLTAITLVIYFGFILLVAFSPATLATPLGGMRRRLLSRSGSVRASPLETPAGRPM